MLHDSPEVVNSGLLAFLNENSRENLGAAAEPNVSRAAVHAGRSSALENSRLFRKLLRSRARF